MSVYQNRILKWVSDCVRKLHSHKSVSLVLTFTREGNRIRVQAQQGVASGQLHMEKGE